MLTFDDLVPSAPTGRFVGISVRGSRIRAMFASAREIIAEWRRRVRSRNELMTLSDGNLRDIGWTKAEVRAECAKPFWQA
jgi:uncharacterized protein YjiS (DUF1127 family)